MNTHYTYLLVLLGCGLVPFLFSFHPRIRFFENIKAFALTSLSVAAFFIGWDILFTHLQVWRFNPDYVTGIYFFGLPLEELLFFLVIPFCSVFTLHSFNILLPARTEKTKLPRTFALALAVVLLFIAFIFLRRLYTSVTFILLAALLISLAVKRAASLPRYFFTWLVILLPFFISNGILTGSLINAPVVMYNNAENLGLRIFTIPVEDLFYGMLLLLLNFAGYEWLLRRRAGTEAATR